MSGLHTKKTLGDAIGRIPILMTLVGLLVVWEAAVNCFAIPQFILPGPIMISKKVLSDFTSGLIFPHLYVTLVEVIAGFLLACIFGISIGAAIGLSPFLEKILYPYIVALETIPKVAIAPLLIIWAGFGIHSKIITAALIAFFPILVNVVAGLKTVDPRRVLLMRSLKASKWQTFAKMRLPSILPHLFAALEIAVIFSIIGAIVGEFLGSARGLGSLVIQRQASIDVAGVFSVLFYLAVMGISLNLGLRQFTRRFAFWSKGPGGGSV